MPTWYKILTDLQPLVAAVIASGAAVISSIVVYISARLSYRASKEKLDSELGAQAHERERQARLQFVQTKYAASTMKNEADKLRVFLTQKDILNLDVQSELAGFAFTTETELLQDAWRVVDAFPDEVIERLAQLRSINRRFNLNMKPTSVIEKRLSNLIECCEEIAERCEAVDVRLEHALGTIRR
jgi:hypothetical protein